MIRMLLADDEPVITRGIQKLVDFNGLGIQVVGVFQDGAAALDGILALKPDIALLDIHMPKKSGIDILKELKAVESKTRIIFISGFQDFQYAKDALRYGAEDYLLKPIKSGDILTCFGKIREDLDRKYQVKEENNSSYYEQIVDKVKKYIEENYKEASLEEAAVLVNLSPNYLSKIFKDKCGTGFSEYLTKTRMEKACELLNDIRYKGYDIAYYIGYDNPKNFSRAFKAYFGMSPKEYRNGKGL